MMFSHFRSSMLILFVLSLIDSALSQSVTLPDPTQCVGPPVTMSSCSAFFSIHDRCAAITSGQASAASCYCVQSVRDKLAGCHQEWWNCFATPDVDSLFTGADGLYGGWSTVCEGFLAYGPTSSSVNSAITVPSLEECQDAYSACGSLSTSITDCSKQYEAESELSTCLCNEQMLYLGSRCDIDGDSCLLTTRDPASIYSNEMCGNVSIGAGIGTTSLSSGRTTSSVGSSMPGSTYRPPTPSPTAASTSAASTGSSSGHACKTLSARPEFVLTVVLMSALFLV